MTKTEKLYNRLLNEPKDLRFEELEKIILRFGYRLCKITGSHAVYRRDGHPTLTIPRKSPVKSYLIEQVLDVIRDEIEENLEEE